MPPSAVGSLPTRGSLRTASESHVTLVNALRIQWSCSCPHLVHRSESAVEGTSWTRTNASTPDRHIAEAPERRSHHSPAPLPEYFIRVRLARPGLELVFRFRRVVLGHYPRLLTIVTDDGPHFKLVATEAWNLQCIRRRQCACFARVRGWCGTVRSSSGHTSGPQGQHDPDLLLIPAQLSK